MLLFLFLVTSSNFNLNAQKTKQEKDQKAIKSMCGCYEVGFNFAETFNYSADEDYKPSKTKNDKALEWVQLVDDKNDKVSMQHLLIVGPPQAPNIVKHWRQDWLFENTDFYMFNGDNEWLYKSKTKDEVAGQWTQKVYQVDDSPRYEGSASWVHVDGKSYWENTTDAPLPRREYTKRSDYNITVRTNRHEITHTGWIHDQDNDKVIREVGKEDVLLAQEKGHNTYVKVADERCKAAQVYWAKNKKKWAIVRTKWDDIFGRKLDLNLELKVEGKQLYKYLFDEAMTDKKEIGKTIDLFVKKATP
ncbi:MAG: hypothetical protein HRT68_06855 [Flavobacteriaceae bacterium]|nr:hypothetical protein [Flavobacteriaceae bacterium]